MGWTQIVTHRDSCLHCPTCGEKADAFEWFQEWYGWHSTCLKCGDQWQDGELCPRPFRRGWRRENIANAIALRERLNAKRGVR